MKKLTVGFTVVELAIVITVIAILATITVVSYRGVQERAEFAKASNDMKLINDAIEIYKARTNTYPTASFCTSNCLISARDLSPALVPNYLDTMPLPNESYGDYRYALNTGGTEYKLSRYYSGDPVTLKTIELTDNPRLDPSNPDSWGYWSPNGSMLNS